MLPFDAIRRSPDSAGGPPRYKVNRFTGSKIIDTHTDDLGKKYCIHGSRKRKDEKSGIDTEAKNPKIDLCNLEHKIREG